MPRKGIPLTALELIISLAGSARSSFRILPCSIYSSLVSVCGLLHALLSILQLPNLEQADRRPTSVQVSVLSYLEQGFDTVAHLAASCPEQNRVRYVSRHRPEGH